MQRKECIKVMNAIDIVNYQYGLVKFPTTFKSPISVVWNITGMCPWICQYCYRDFSGKDLSDEQLLNIAKQIVDFEIVQVVIQGGEPLIKKPLLHKILKLFAENKIITTVMTSGYNLQKDDISLFEDCNTAVRVGLDGVNEELHNSIRGHAGAYNAAISALKLLSEKIDKVIVDTVLFKKNYLHIGDLIDYIANFKNIHYMQAHVFIQKGQARTHQEQQLSFEQRQYVMETIAKKTTEYEGRLSCSIKDPTLELRQSMRTRVPNMEMVIESDGTVKMSPWIPITLGSLNSSSLIDIWHSGMEDCWKNEHVQAYLSGMKSVNDLSENFQIERG